jgi:hypothetical protein
MTTARLYECVIDLGQQVPADVDSDMQLSACLCVMLVFSSAYPVVRTRHDDETRSSTYHLHGRLSFISPLLLPFRYGGLIPGLFAHSPTSLQQKWRSGEKL